MYISHAVIIGPHMITLFAFNFELLLCNSLMSIWSRVLGWFHFIGKPFTAFWATIPSHP